jgi:hypothetical protein
MSRQGSFILASTGADWNGAGQCLRSLQHRHWSIQLPHRWTDAGPQGASSLGWPATVYSPEPRVRSELFGSLGATGHGHGSYNAVLLRLEGEEPETVDTTSGPVRAEEIKRTGQLRLKGTHPAAFDPEGDLILHRRRSLPFHPNGMTFTAYDDGQVLCERTYYSIGGGFVLDDDGSGHPELLPDPTPVPYPFRTGTELLDFCNQESMSTASRSGVVRRRYISGSPETRDVRKSIHLLPWIG